MHASISQSMNQPSIHPCMHQSINQSSMHAPPMAPTIDEIPFSCQTESSLAVVQSISLLVTPASTKKMRMKTNPNDSIPDIVANQVFDRCWREVNELEVSLERNQIKLLFSNCCEIILIKWFVYLTSIHVLFVALSTTISAIVQTHNAKPKFWKLIRKDFWRFVRISWSRFAKIGICYSKDRIFTLKILSRSLKDRIFG